MKTSTESEVWVPENPLVVFIVPADDAQRYAAVMNQLTLQVLQRLNWPLESVELVGLIADTPDHGAEGIYALGTMGIDPRDVILVVLWGETYESVEFEGHVSPECGVGFIALTNNGVVLPAMCMPSIEGDWWLDPTHLSYATETYVELIENGRVRPDSSDYMIFISHPAAWN